MDRIKAALQEIQNPHAPLLKHDKKSGRLISNGLKKEIDRMMFRSQKARESANERWGAMVGFAEFYAAYPRKMGKGQAEKTWAKLAPSPELRKQIMQGAARLAASVERGAQDKKFTKHPSTWLNAKGWEDDLDDSETTPAACNFEFKAREVSEEEVDALLGVNG